jgi:hypothetical protein
MLPPSSTLNIEVGLYPVHYVKIKLNADDSFKDLQKTSAVYKILIYYLTLLIEKKINMGYI